MSCRTLFLAALVAPACLPVVSAAADDAPPMSMAMPMSAPVRVGDIEISGSFARATLPGAPVGGVYVTVTNRGAVPDTLVSAKSPAAASVSLHAMSMNGNVMQMRDLPQGIDIPAGQTVAMSPDGLHLMFEHLAGALVEGKTVPVTLTFARAGSVEIVVPVLGIAATGPMQGMGM